MRSDEQGPGMGGERNDIFIPAFIHKAAKRLC